MHMTNRDELFWAESAGGAARNPAGWHASAESLWRAAGILRDIWEADLRTTFATMTEQRLDGFNPPPDVGRVFMMLAGFALEALIKGIIVAETPEVVQPDPTRPTKLFRWKGSGHELRNLLKELEFPMSDPESDVLRRLEAFLRWGGRYPASMQALEMRYGPDTPPPASFSTEDFFLLDELWKRLRERLEISAQARQIANEKQDAAKRAARRAELLDELKRLAHRDEDGVTVFENPDAADEPGALVCCCQCQAQLTLNARRPAAICRCGMLYHCEPFFDGSLGRVIPRVETYPSSPSA
jgi:hypothetical protein